MPVDADRCARLAVITARIAELGKEIVELSVERRTIVRELHEQGYSHARIAAVAGLVHGRIHQIIHGPAAKSEWPKDGQSP